MKALNLLLLFTVFSFAQTRESVVKQIDSANFFIREGSKANNSEYVLKAFSILSEIKNDSIVRNRAIKWGLNAYWDKDSLVLKKSSETLRKLFLKNKNLKDLAKYQHYKALYFRINYVLDSAFYYYQESKKTSISINDSIQVARRLLSMSDMQRNIKDYRGSEISLIEGLSYIEPSDEFQFKANFYSNLGLTYLANQEHEKAKLSFDKGNELNKKITSKTARDRGYLLYLNNIGFNEVLQENYTLAKSYFEKGLQFDSIKQNQPYAYTLLLGNYSDCLYALGDKEGYYSRVDEIIKIKEETKDLQGLATVLVAVSYKYRRDKEYKKARESALRAYNIAHKTTQREVILQSLAVLADLTKEPKSKKYFAEYVALNDSLIIEQSKSKGKFTRIRYETEKKEAENAKLQLDISQKQLEVEQEKRVKLIALFFSIVSVLVIVFGFLFYRDRQNKILYISKLEKATARENERKQIAKSLHDEVAGDIRLLHQKLINNEQIEEAESLESIKNNVRNLSHQLSSISFDDVSFKEQFIGLISDYMSSDFRIQPEGIHEIDFTKLAEPIKRVLFLSIREILQNTLKHAKASTLTVSFFEEKDAIKVVIKDNGVGFDSSKKSKGIGIRNIKERVIELNGKLNIISSEIGTITEIIIPRNEK